MVYIGSDCSIRRLFPTSPLDARPPPTPPTALTQKHDLSPSQLCIQEQNSRPYGRSPSFSTIDALNSLSLKSSTSPPKKKNMSTAAIKSILKSSKISPTTSSRSSATVILDTPINNKESLSDPLYSSPKNSDVLLYVNCSSEINFDSSTSMRGSTPEYGKRKIVFDSVLEYICFFDKFESTSDVADAPRMEIDDCFDMDAPTASSVFLTQTKFPLSGGDTISPWELVGGDLQSSISVGSASGPIMLQRIQLKDDVLIGIICVKNLAFQKSVSIRYSCDNWMTPKELDTRFSSIVSHPTQDYTGLDQFTFELFLDDELDLSATIGRISFAIRYDVNGMTHWDNNQGKDYVVNISRKNNFGGVLHNPLITSSAAQKSTSAPIPVSMPTTNAWSLNSSCRSAALSSSPWLEPGVCGSPLGYGSPLNSTQRKVRVLSPTSSAIPSMINSLPSKKLYQDPYSLPILDESGQRRYGTPPSPPNVSPQNASYLSISGSGSSHTPSLNYSEIPFSSSPLSSPTHGHLMYITTAASSPVLGSLHTPTMVRSVSPITIPRGNSPPTFGSQNQRYSFSSSAISLCSGLSSPKSVSPIMGIPIGYGSSGFSNLSTSPVEFGKSSAITMSRSPSPSQPRKASLLRNQEFMKFPEGSRFISK